MAASELPNTAEQESVRPQPQKQKRFQCQRCQRPFARLEHLQRHERTHTQEKPFLCRQCDSRFARSDLLIRHERLSHKNTESSRATNQTHDGSELSARPNKRVRIYSGDSPDRAHPEEALDEQAHSPTAQLQKTHLLASQSTGVDSSHRSALEALSLAAEQSAFQDSLATATGQAYSIGRDLDPDPLHRMPPVETMPGPITVGGPSISGEMDFEQSLGSLAAFLENEPLSSYHISSLIAAEQPIPFFSPDSLINSVEFENNAEDAHHENFHSHHHPHQAGLEDPHSFSRFGSRLPSLQPEEQSPEIQYEPPHRAISEISNEDRQKILSRMAEFTTVPPEFRLPTRLALSRYVGAYINGFHEHMPFLHIPTMTLEHSSVELILAMAAVGAQYCFESEKGVELFHVSRAIATERIRRRDARLATNLATYHYEEPAIDPWLSNIRGYADSPRAAFNRNSVNGPLGLPSDPGSTAASQTCSENLMQTAQALLVLMAMATWAKHKEILREALAIQSVLATLVRDDGLRSPAVSEDNICWEDWARLESITRTKFIVFCFFNLHCIVYNIPPLILNSELKMRLPCTAAEFRADSSAKWQQVKSTEATQEFEGALRRLFSRGGREVTEWNSSLGNYILIHAIIQQIFFLRQTARCRFDGAELTGDEFAYLEQALRNWQMGWKRNPESSLNPMDPNGPVAFNSTALLRIAYIRLNMDTGPGRALDTRDPVQIASALCDSPTIKRTPKLVRAVLHSAHALSIPIKIGIRLVSKTQTFMWSIQHSLCSLECAFLLSKWLEAVSSPDADTPITEDEKRIISIVKTMLDETEFAVPDNNSFSLQELTKYLNAGVLRVWATIFHGAQTWAIVDVIGSSLSIYAKMLESA